MHVLMKSINHKNSIKKQVMEGLNFKSCRSTFETIYYIILLKLVWVPTKFHGGVKISFVLSFKFKFKKKKKNNLLI